MDSDNLNDLSNSTDLILPPNYYKIRAKSGITPAIIRKNNVKTTKSIINILDDSGSDDEGLILPKFIVSRNNSKSKKELKIFMNIEMERALNLIFICFKYVLKINKPDFNNVSQTSACFIDFSDSIKEEILKDKSLIPLFHSIIELSENIKLKFWERATTKISKIVMITEETPEYFKNLLFNKYGLIIGDEDPEERFFKIGNYLWYIWEIVAKNDDSIILFDNPTFYENLTIDYFKYVYSNNTSRHKNPFTNEYYPEEFKY
jgi:hypothetical protein